jgi:hypothetical protein
VLVDLEGRKVVLVEEPHLLCWQNELVDWVRERERHPFPPARVVDVHLATRPANRTVLKQEWPRVDVRRARVLVVTKPKVQS